MYGKNNRLITLGQMKGTPDSALCLAPTLLLFDVLPYGHHGTTNGDPGKFKSDYRIFRDRWGA